MARMPVWLAALWWGSFSTIGFLVVPMLFSHLPTPQMAGGMAARLFSSQTWVSCVCGLSLLMLLRANQVVVSVRKAHTAMIFIVAGMLFAILTEFAIAPKIVARQNLRLWHSIGSVLYLMQWVCAAVTFGRLSGPSQYVLRPDNVQV